MKTTDTEADKEALRIVELLAKAVKRSGRSYRSLEEELGLGSSVVSKILAGVIRPQLSYVLMITRAIGLPPAQLFRGAYPLPGPAHPFIKELLDAQKREAEEERDLLKEKILEVLADVLLEIERKLGRRREA